MCDDIAVDDEPGMTGEMLIVSMFVTCTWWYMREGVDLLLPIVAFVSFIEAAASALFTSLHRSLLSRLLSLAARPPTTWCRLRISAASNKLSI